MTNEFKYELHLHTYPCSKCATSSIEEMVDAAVEKGFAGFAVTNHFYRGNTGIDRNLSWQEFVEAYNADYLRGKSYGKNKGIDVLFGLESSYDKGKEILVYGLSPEDVKQMPEFMDAPLDVLSASVHAHGGLCYYAHPFRTRSYIDDPDTEPDITLTDGIEVFNYCNSPDRNAVAEDFALRNHLPVICGGDVHSSQSFGKSAIVVKERIVTNEDLISVLRSGDYRLSYI